MQSTPNPTQPRPISRLATALKHGALAIIIAGFVIAATGAGYQTIAASADQHTYPAPGQLIDVGGFKLHIHCLGSGSPTVILEALAGGFSSQWGWIQPAVAQQTRVCAYDRAGYGWSETDSQPESLARSVQNLHSLLARANVSGPYVLVGHSKGGLIVRAFAAQYHQEVVGIGLLDASHPDQFVQHPDWLAGETSLLPWVPTIQVLMRLGVGHAYFAAGGEVDFKDLPARQHAEMAAAWSSPEYWASMRRSMAGATEFFGQAHSLGSLGQLPLMVISAGQGHQPGWDELQDELANLSTNSVHRLIPAASHASLAFNPDHAQQVSADIIALVRAAQTGQPLAAD